MIVGISAVNVADKILNSLLRAEAWPEGWSAAVYGRLHVGDPGDPNTGTPGDNPALGSDVLEAITHSAPVLGVASMNGTAPSWTNTGGVTETLTHIAYWTHPSVSTGSFLCSAALTEPREWTPGQVFTLHEDTWTVGPLATGA